MIAQDLHTRRILDEIASGKAVSQRWLARELGIALGLTNRLLRRLVRQGCVRLLHVQPNRVRYVITALGIDERARMSREYLQRNVRLYAETRNRIMQGLLGLAADAADAATGSGRRGVRVVLYGAAEVGEIAYVCLRQTTGLRLVGVVDESRPKRFFGRTVLGPEQLRGTELNGTRFDRVFVTALDETERVRSVLESQQVPADHVVYL